LKFSLKQKQYIDTAFGLPLLLVNKFFAVILGRLLFRNHALNRPPKKIIIIKMLGLGSVIMAADALVSIKKKYPASSFEIICSESIEAGIRSLKLFDKVHIIKDSSYLQIAQSSIQVISSFWFKRCWIIDLEVYSKLSSLLSLWTLAVNRFGFYFDEVNFRNNINTHNVFFDTQSGVIENYNRMAKEAGVTTFERYLIEGYESRSAQQKYSYIAINNTCSELARERLLTPEQLKNICLYILQNTTYKIALLGAPNDRVKMDEYIEFIGESGVENYAGTFQFSDYYNFLHQHCKLIITVDSAPLHIAQKLGLPTLSIWGPTTPQSRIITDDSNQIIFHQAPCSPCAHISGELPCKGNNFCIKEITPAEIITKLKGFI
jgi:ADP-heptose:LPS heptosyltransferase